MSTSGQHLTASIKYLHMMHQFQISSDARLFHIKEDVGKRKCIHALAQMYILPWQCGKMSKNRHLMQHLKKLSLCLWVTPSLYMHAAVRQAFTGKRQIHDVTDERCICAGNFIRKR